MSYSRRGGARLGAGRPRKRDAGVPHDRRPELSGRTAVHVTLGLCEHVYNLRSRRCFEPIREAFLAAGVRPDFRAVGVAVEGNHLHLLAEAACAAALSEGIHGLKIRIARGLNRVMGRTGPVFDERYQEHVLRTPQEAARAIAYVSGNTARHAAQAGRPLPAGYRDPYTVGHFGDRVLLPDGTAGMVAPPETWLLRDGWRCAGATPVPVVRRVRGEASIPAPFPLFGWPALPKASGENPAGDGLSRPTTAQASAVVGETSPDSEMTEVETTAAVETTPGPGTTPGLETTQEQEAAPGPETTPGQERMPEVETTGPDPVRGLEAKAEAGPLARRMPARGSGATARVSRGARERGQGCARGGAVRSAA